MKKATGTVVAVKRSTTTVKFIDSAKEFLGINHQIQVLNSRKKALMSYFLGRFEGKEVVTYTVEEEHLMITKVEGVEREKFDYRKLYADHPELKETLDQYLSYSEKSADYVKISETK